MKKFLAVVCALIILGLFPITLLSTIAKYRVFTATATKQLVRSSQIGEQLPNLVATKWASNSNNTMTTAEAEDFLAKALPPATVYKITDQSIDVIAHWWSTDARIEDLPLVLDLSVVQENFKLGNGLFLDWLRLSGGDLTLPSTMEINVQEILQERATENPTQFAGINQQITLMRQWSKFIGNFLWFGWALLSLCLLSIILLRHRPSYAIFGWLGWVTCLCALEIVPLMIGLWFLPGLITPWLNTSLEPAQLTVLIGLLTTLAKALLWPMVWVSGGLMLGAIISWIIRGIMKHNSSQPPAASPLPVAATTPPSPSA